MLESRKRLRYLFLNDGIFVVRVVGLFQMGDGFIERLALRHSVPSDRRNTAFVDLSLMTDADIRGGDIMTMATSQQYERAELKRSARIALYAPEGSTAYGIARMYEAFAQSAEFLDVCLFVDPDEALDWLGSSDNYADITGRSDWLIA
ncbi:hypothetical protein [Tropicibacter oceani]|uniref:STAS/SEC14 domain-containing protein n=1 Tax=Tropicibacter oceani TaxID=3058420 RepID=A0ABY8QL29_9RHOB|nr:hypothetical protein [Tropicibacter oceani]WGW04718.1 hypothetical protein QF118_03970 [Tropicibacter oceani]